MALNFVVFLICLLALEALSDFEMTQESVDKINSMNAGFKVRLYERFAGRSVEELKHILGVSNHPYSHSWNDFNNLESDSNDYMEFDASKKWPNCTSIKEIPNQNKCNAFGPFAVVSAMRDRICIATNQVSSPLSAYDIIACCPECLESDDDDDDNKWCGQFGISHDSAFQYLISKGVVSGGYSSNSSGCLPYPIDEIPDEITCPTECQAGYNKTYAEDKRKFYKQKVFSKANKRVMAEIIANGPVVAQFELFQDLTLYEGGVYKHVNGDSVGQAYAKVIGWGITDSGQAYWTAVSSMGADWGDSGMFRISRGNDECGFESAMLTASVKP